MAARARLRGLDVLGLEPVQDLEQLRDDWARLGEASGNIFSSWEWNSLWWNHFGAGRRLRTFAYRDADGVAVIVPLYGWRERPLRILRFLGHGHGDLLGPVCGDPKTAADALRAALQRTEFDVFVGDWLLADEKWSEQLGGRILRETGYPILRFVPGSSWDEFLATRSRSFRKDARAEVRKLEREHQVAFRMTQDASTLGRDLDTLFHLHRARFGAHEGCYFCGENEPFQREFAAAALERGWLRLWLLDVDGEPVATEYGFRFGDSHFAYQTGREPAWDRASVGSVLENHAIRRALEDGVREYRFLQGNESYKYRYATEDPELEAVGVAGSSLGRIALGATATLRRVKPFAALAKRAAG